MFYSFWFYLKGVDKLAVSTSIMLWDVHIKYAHDTWITIRSPDSRTGYSLNMWRVCKKSCENIRINALMKYTVSKCIHDMDSIYSTIECICKTEWKRHSVVVNSADPCEISMCFSFIVAFQYSCPDSLHLTVNSQTCFAWLVSLGLTRK